MWSYLIDFINHEGVDDPSPWVPADVAARIRTAAEDDTSGRLKPIHEALGGEISYEDIKVVIACGNNAE